MGKKSHFFILVSILTIAFYLHPGKLSPIQKNGPKYWELRLLLTSTGDYNVKEGKKSNAGRYTFTVLWTGCMELDHDYDYLVYHEKSEILDWKAEEVAQSPESSHKLSEDDFPEKPFLDFHYIMRRASDLHFFFEVDSFYVPQNSSDQKFFLNLPASEEEAEPQAGFNYNAFLSKGSNRIHVKEDEIFLNPLEKTYNWNWKYHKWHKGSKNPVRFSNIHKAQVTLTIIPHY